MKKLNRKIRTKWTRALRSGGYKQGVGRLCFSTSKGKKFCCLGVLADIQGAEWKVTASAFNPVRLPLIDKIPVSANIDTPAFLSPEFRKEVGLSKRAESRLAELNDNGKTFKEIAKWIEKFL